MDQYQRALHNLTLPRHLRSRVPVIVEDFTPEEETVIETCLDCINGQLHAHMNKSFGEREFKIKIERNEQNRPQLEIYPQGWIDRAQTTPDSFQSDLYTIQRVMGELAGVLTVQAKASDKLPVKYEGLTVMSFTSILDLARAIKTFNPKIDISAVGERTAQPGTP